MSLIAEFEEYVEKTQELLELCKNISMCEADAPGDFTLADYLVDPAETRDQAFGANKNNNLKGTIALRESHDAMSAMDRVDTFINMDRSFFYEIYAPIDYEVQKKNLDFKLGTLTGMLSDGY